MFNKIISLFKNNESTPQKGEKLPGTNLSYDPNLINQFENQIPATIRDNLDETETVEEEEMIVVLTTADQHQ